MMEITAKKVIDGNERSATVQVDLGDSLQDAVAKFGEEVVLSNFQSNAKITCQGAIRRMLEDGAEEPAIAARLAAWKPGTTLDRVQVNPVDALKAMLKSMDPAAAKAMLAELKASAPQG